MRCSCTSSPERESALNLRSSHSSHATRSLTATGSILAGLLPLALLTGCMVGPKYVKPTAPTAPSFKEANSTETNTDQSKTSKETGPWQPAQPNDATARGEWWTIFNDAELNELEPQLAVSNQ